MRILDLDTNKAIETVCLYLTASETKQMIGALEDILSQQNAKQMEHAHVNDEEYEREVTVAIYTDKNLHQFDDRSQKLIAEGR